MATYVYGYTDCPPNEAGYHEDRLALLSDYVGSLVDSGRIQAGSFLMARDGKVFAHQSTGKLTHKSDAPDFHPDSIKRIASVTKLFTATAVMKLVEDGALWLEQPVKDIIPEFDTTTHGGITLWHLLTHTSGLPADPGYFLEAYPIPWFDQVDRDDWIRHILSGPLQNQPGECWSYCSLGYAILGEVISRASQMHYNDYVQQHIFSPLGMNQSFLDLPDSAVDEVCVYDDEELQDIKHSAYRIPNRPPRSGGGAFSTLHDLYRFGQCFLSGGTLDGNRILGRKTVETMTRNHLDDVPSFHWGKRCKNYRQGLGWGFYCDGPTVSPSCYNHEGWGWVCFYVDSQENFIYVSFAQDNKEWDPDVQVKPRTIAWSGIV